MSSFLTPTGLPSSASCLTPWRRATTPAEQTRCGRRSLRAGDGRVAARCPPPAELYLAGAIDLASVVAGLCTGAGVGLLVLFRVNRGLKENLGIAALLYGFGAAAGLVIQLVQFAF